MHIDPDFKDCNALAGGARASREVTLGRRRFVELAALGGVALLLSSAPVKARAPGTCEALVLSCMDYRLVDDVVRYMDGLGLTDDYDHVALAGASAGAVHSAFAEWHETWWQHLQAAIDLHGIKRVLVVDHRDCGAYKIALGTEHLATPESEREAHAGLLGELAGQIAERQPGLAVETYLMAVDGSVERIG